MKLQLSTSPFMFCIFLCAATIAVAQQISAPTPQTGTITGTVLDVNGGVVPGATVVLRGPTSGDDRHLVTSENGFFQFSDVKSGIPYHVFVNARDFADWTSSELVLKGGQFLILKSIELRVSTVQVTVNAILPEQLAAAQVKAEEKQRVFGVIPNFYVIYSPDAAPLTPKLKFRLAMKALLDPVTVAGFGFNAAIYQMADYPSYHQGARGYAERLGATFAGGSTNVLIGDGILPSLLHQDPRYFYQGTGTTKSRLLHALSSPFITRGDNGHQQMNFSSIGGDLASGAIANAYYPAEDRGAWRVFSSALIGTGGRMMEGIFQEFVLRKHTSNSAQ